MKRKENKSVIRWRISYLLFNKIAVNIKLNTVSPTRREFFHSANEEFSRLTFDGGFHCCLHFIVWLEINSLQGSPQFWQEIGWSQIWTIRRSRNNFKFQTCNNVMCRACGAWPSVIMLQHYRLGWILNPTFTSPQMLLNVMAYINGKWRWISIDIMFSRVKNPITVVWTSLTSHSYSNSL